jgi:hypothetical protein
MRRLPLIATNDYHMIQKARPRRSRDKDKPRRHMDTKAAGSLGVNALFDDEALLGST